MIDPQSSSSSGKVQSYYNQLNTGYSKVWMSPAKQRIDRFEKRFVDDVITRATVSGKQIKVLEIGTGTGRIASEIVKFNVEYYGIDISEAMVKSAKNLLGSRANVKEIVVGNVSEKVPFGNELFDSVIAIRVLYFNRNWKEILKHLSDRIGTGGYLAFTMPNIYSTSILGRITSRDIDASYTTSAEIQYLLKDLGYKEINISTYARVPDVIYDACRTPLAARILHIFEDSLSRLFPGSVLGRMLYVRAHKA